jgi:hypothetical protein
MKRKASRPLIEWALRRATMGGRVWRAIAWYLKARGWYIRRTPKTHEPRVYRMSDRMTGERVRRIEDGDFQAKGQA